MKQKKNYLAETKKKQEKLNNKKFSNAFLQKNQNYLVLTILLVTGLVYLRVFNNELTTRDDIDYIIKNPYISNFNYSTLKLIFTNFYMGNYHPLSMICYAIGYQIGGIQPWPYQAINLVLHLINVVLVFVFIKDLLLYVEINLQMKFLVPYTVSLLFGIHPMHVESVAWISENKNVLFTLFFFLSLIFYLKHVRKNEIKFYLLSLLFFILSLLSKAMAVSLSLTLVAIDIFLNRKFNSKFVLLEKIPFFALSAVFGILAIFAQESASAIYFIGEGGEFNLMDKIIVASYGLVHYILKLIYPYNLTAQYEYPNINNYGFPLVFFIYPVIVIVIFLLSYQSIKKSRILTFGFLFFLLNIVLVLQFIPVGDAMMAERYVYIPSIGIFFIISYFIVKSLESRSMKAKPLYFFIAIYFVLLSGITYQRIGVWKNSLTLWEDILEKGNYKSHSIGWWARAGIYNDQGRFEEALQDINTFINSYPNFGMGYFRRAYSKLNLKDYDGALLDLIQAEELGTMNEELYNNKGMVLNALQEYDKAIINFTKALNLNDTLVNAYHGRADARIQLQDLEGALKDLNESIKLNPYKPEVFNNRGVVRGKLGDVEGAINDFTAAISLNRNFLSAYQNRVDAYFNINDFEKALNDLNYVLSFQESPYGYYYRCKLHMKLGNKENACSDLRKARDLGYYFFDQEVIDFCKS